MNFSQLPLHLSNYVLCLLTVKTGRLVLCLQNSAMKYLKILGE